MIEGGQFCEDLQVLEFKELSGKALFLKNERNEYYLQRNPIFLCLFWTKLFINVTSKCLLRKRWGVTRPLQRICMRVPNEQVKEDTIWVAYFLFLLCMSAFFFRGPYGNSWKLGVLISHIEEVDALDYSFFVCARMPNSTAGIGCLAWRFGPRNNTECCIQGHGGNVIS